mmetsp:Transcript_5078/g.8172  ORF Transcript_5078/g.8172 Transcript_5078/m.8172 type:complete len:174 (-) Transcript_5078:499-1020(-)
MKLPLLSLFGSLLALAAHSFQQHSHSCGRVLPAAQHPNFSNVGVASITTQHRRTLMKTKMTFDDELPDFATREKIQNIIDSHTIVVFMKGTQLMPSCGFSGTVVRILESLNAPFESIDVMQNDRIRSEVKRLSNWPTIPQVYINGEFIGGADILIEMYQSGELQEMVEVALAS